MLKENVCLLTTKEVAQLLGVTVNYLEKKRCYYGDGPKYTRIAKRAIRYKMSDIDEYINERSGYTSTFEYKDGVPSKRAPH